MKDQNIGSIFIICNMDEEELLDFDFSIEVEKIEDEDLDTIKKEIGIYEQDLINNHIEN